ncbi:zinc finger E-box-binding homeobox 1 [Denticeps clupeoides]|uniref:zinc finger E-box-binding homeobox 1 n=1 Tax=Denticeps clupeoides TaxID=299321 RepID=UPI0010A488E7|nr:zinc finger E-box-binding homeobox 1-like [Denticeps clupeoides]XP_028836295.1 zinc finger E-box-binding homeobox 1-like [Denticeps clupeoides]XP_028836296.1 zinc finger E-box-binding homeobox 1-like [Denticeps clupeoides]XP_028836297.1 zinc finger E-box-binding homeobox 1-like [Denticeps clupeoides]
MQTEADAGGDNVLEPYAVGAEVELRPDEAVQRQPASTTDGFPPLYNNVDYRCPVSSSDDDSSSEDHWFKFHRHTQGCVCWECGQHFNNMRNLVDHFHGHTSDRRCHLCGVTFKWMISLAMHLDNAHQNISLSCCKPNCETLSQNWWHLNKHLGKHHRANDGYSSEKIVSSQENSEEVLQATIDGNTEIKLEQEKETGIDTSGYPKPTSLNEDHTYHQSESIQHDIKTEPPVAQIDRNNCKLTYNGKEMTTAYALRVRHTKSITTIFPREALPAVAHQKKIQVFVLRSAQQDNTEAEAAGSRSCILKGMPIPHAGVSAEQEETKPELAECAPLQWDSEEELAEEEVMDEDLQSDDSLPAGDTEYSPESKSETDSLPFDSDDNWSQNSSYVRKRKGHHSRTRAAIKLPHMTSAINPEMPTLSSVKCPHCDLGPFVCLKRHLSVCSSKEKTLSRRGPIACDEDRPETQLHANANPVVTCMSCWQPFANVALLKQHTCLATPSVAQGQSQVPTVPSVTQPSPYQIIRVVPTSVSAAPTQQTSRMSQAVAGKRPSSLVSASNAVKIIKRLTNPAANLASPSTTSTVHGGGRTQVVLPRKGTFDPQAKLVTAQVPLRCPQANAPNSTAALELKNLLLQGVIKPQTLVSTLQSTVPSSLCFSKVPQTSTVIHVPSPAKVAAPLNVCKPASLGTASSPVDVIVTSATRNSAPTDKWTLLPTDLRLFAPSVKAGPQGPQDLLIKPQSSSSFPSNTLRWQLFGAIRPQVITPVPASSLWRGPALVPSPSVPDLSCHNAAPLKILGLFVNQSKQVSLQLRLKMNWRSKIVYTCRQCGAVSRQPCLAVQHRYLHQGVRPHRCACGRTFHRQLHLLRHQVVHADTVHYICATCGRTFHGALALSRHKKGPARRGQKRLRKQCMGSFTCKCGLKFLRPSSFLWHKLKNGKNGLHSTMKSFRPGHHD